MWPFTTHFLKQKLEKFEDNQRVLENMVIKLQVKNDSVSTCDDQGCGSVFHIRSLQSVRYLSPLSSRILHFCSKHRRPYDKIESIPGKEIHYYKNQEPLVEVTAKGKTIKQSNKK